MDLAGCEATQEDLELLSHPLVAGVILFSRNFTHPEQLLKLTEQLRQSVAKPLLITVDQEGGRVQRFRQGLTTLPALQAFSALISDPEEQNFWAERAGWQMASEMLALNIDLSFAPVLDLGHRSLAIGDRSFSQDKATVLRLARAFIQGMQRAGMANCAKHFPGHGHVFADSHIETPIDTRTKEEIFAQDLQPFKCLIAENKLRAIMPAHVIYPHCDNAPASGSQYWLQKVLRQELHFNGVIFSDDLGMQGAAFLGNYSERCQKAFQQGCDLLLLCNNRPALKEVLAHFEVQETLAEKAQREMRFNALLKQKNVDFAQLQKQKDYLENRAFLTQLQQKWLMHKNAQMADPTEKL